MPQMFTVFGNKDSEQIQMHVGVPSNVLLPLPFFRNKNVAD